MVHVIGYVPGSLPWTYVVPHAGAPVPEPPPRPMTYDAGAGSPNVRFACVAVTVAGAFVTPCESAAAELAENLLPLAGVYVAVTECGEPAAVMVVVAAL